MIRCDHPKKGEEQMKKWIPLVLAALLLMTTAACGKVTELVQDTVTKQDISNIDVKKILEQINQK